MVPLSFRKTASRAGAAIANQEILAAWVKVGVFAADSRRVASTAAKVL